MGRIASLLSGSRAIGFAGRMDPAGAARVNAGWRRIMVADHARGTNRDHRPLIANRDVIAEGITEEMGCPVTKFIRSDANPGCSRNLFRDR
jgi:hypothetical protein